MKARFCGAITGSVARRPGETDEDAIARAEATILAVLDANCKRLGLNVGLEPDDTPEPG